MNKKYLVYITPLESFTPPSPHALYLTPTSVNCNITFITGDLDHKTIISKVDTDFFIFYYFGSALEVIELDNQNNIVNIRDITKADLLDFNISLRNIITLNNKTFDMLATNGFTYNMKQNKFYNYCKQTVENIYNEIQNADNFSLRVYIQNETVVYIELEKDIDPSSNNKIALSSGFVASDKSKLKISAVKNNTGVTDNKLTQDNVDKLITKLLE